jgi:predicted transposase/invertase (TIGR01784 family)
MTVAERKGKAEGLAEGLAEGKAEGKAEGLAAGKMETAIALLAKGLDSKLIADCTGLSVEEVNALGQKCN